MKIPSKHASQKNWWITVGFNRQIARALHRASRAWGSLNVKPVMVYEKDSPLIFRTNPNHWQTCQPSLGRIHRMVFRSITDRFWHQPCHWRDMNRSFLTSRMSDNIMTTLCVFFLPDGDQMIIESSNKTVQWWNLRTGIGAKFSWAGSTLRGSRATVSTVGTSRWRSNVQRSATAGPGEVERGSWEYFKAGEALEPVPRPWRVFSHAICGQVERPSLTATHWPQNIRTFHTKRPMSSLRTTHAYAPIPTLITNENQNPQNPISIQT